MQGRSTWTLSVLMLSVACGPAAQESSREESPVEVPEALALALIGNATPESRLFVGALPSALAENVPVPLDLPLVGGLIRDDEGGTLVFEAGESAESTLLAFEQQVADEGWEQAPDLAGLRGGFVQSPRPVAETWCSEDHWLRANGVSFEESEGLRVLYYKLEPGQNPCEDPRARQQQMGMGHYGLTLPTLESPLGAEVRSTGGGGSFDSHYLDASIVADLGVAELFDHYSRQLEQAGWDDGVEASRGALAIGQWATEDAQGEPTIGILAIWQMSRADSYRAMLRMERIQEDD